MNVMSKCKNIDVPSEIEITLLLSHEISVNSPHIKTGTSNSHHCVKNQTWINFPSKEIPIAGVRIYCSMINGLIFHQ